jgi:hypothetical protein
MATLQTYRENPTLFFINMWKKFSAIWSNIELPDNFSYGHFALHSSLLQSLPRFACIWLPAAVGFIMLAARWVNRRTAQRRAGPPALREDCTDSIPFSTDGLGMLVVILTVQVLALSLTPVMSRYRIVIVPFLMLPAAWVFAQAFIWIGSRQWPRVGLMFTLLAGTLAVWLLWPVNSILATNALQPHHFEVGARLLAVRADFAAALAEYELGITYFHSHGDGLREFLLRCARRRDFPLPNWFGKVQESQQLLIYCPPPN